MERCLRSVVNSVLDYHNYPTNTFEDITQKRCHIGRFCNGKQGKETLYGMRATVKRSSRTWEFGNQTVKGTGGDWCNSRSRERGEEQAF